MKEEGSKLFTGAHAAQASCFKVYQKQQAGNSCKTVSMSRKLLLVNNYLERQDGLYGIRLCVEMVQT